ncbi:MAG: hypothetical protein J6B02_03680 [Selenomonadales bacterium]|nr:hypothetical protein [Selenomonadales bacterium]
MSRITAAHLKTGTIYGDQNTHEYVYMPASEIGYDEPVCVYEFGGKREDITLTDAVEVITKRSLRPTSHPLLGRNSLEG